MQQLSPRGETKSRLAFPNSGVLGMDSKPHLENRTLFNLELLQVKVSGSGMSADPKWRPKNYQQGTGDLAISARTLALGRALLDDIAYIDEQTTPLVQSDRNLFTGVSRRSVKHHWHINGGRVR